jgi:hypothetical protein
MIHHSTHFNRLWLSVANCAASFLDKAAVKRYGSTIRDEGKGEFDSFACGSSLCLSLSLTHTHTHTHTHKLTAFDGASWPRCDILP